MMVSKISSFEVNFLFLSQMSSCTARVLKPLTIMGWRISLIRLVMLHQPTLIQPYTLYVIDIVVVL